MSQVLHDYLDAATQKAAADLVDALLALPEDRRDWKPASGARSALDQVAECAIINNYTADLIRTRQWPSEGYEAFLEEKTALLAEGWDALHARLLENTRAAIAALRTVAETGLADAVPLPWGSEPMSAVIAYPYWNMTYHLGQIIYIKSLIEPAA